jgi:hypothetical protein
MITYGSGGPRLAMKLTNHFYGNLTADLVVCGGVGGWRLFEKSLAVHREQYLYNIPLDDRKNKV